MCYEMKKQIRNILNNFKQVAKQSGQYFLLDNVNTLQCEIEQLEEELSFTRADLDTGTALLEDAQIEIDSLKKELAEKQDIINNMLLSLSGRLGI
jgi:SMC interacting uncharacterized protein involved in chromosome segregation